jgi:hypothetical protein
LEVSCGPTAGTPVSSYSGPSPFGLAVPIPKSCRCNDTITVTVDCHQGLGVPSSAAQSTTLTFDCGNDCCPRVQIATPTVTATGAGAVASFSLSTAVTWVPSGCAPPVTITGFRWTVTQGATQFSLVTTNPTASTDAGNWTLVSTGAAASVPLALAPGAWNVKVRPVFSPGQLSANCDPSSDTPFTIPTPPTHQCCPRDPMTAPNGVSVAVATTGTVPAATATFTATIHWPKKCPKVTPSLFLWEVTDPGNKKYTRQTTTNVTHSNDPGADWELNNALIGALPFNSGGGYSVVCTVQFPVGSSADGCVTFGSTPFQVAGTPPTTPPTCCPSVTVGPAITGTTASFTATTTWPAGCPNVAATSFAWTVTDKTTNTTFTKTTATASTDQTGFTPNLTLTPGDSYDVSVTPAYPGVMLPAGCSTTGMTTVTVPTPPGGGFNVCAFLLVLAIILLLLGGVILVIGICINVVWVWIVGAAIGVIGLVIFIIWAFLCAKQTPCTLMWTMECILDWIVKTGWIVALIVAIIGFLGGSLPCSIAAIGVWGGWAVIDSLLRTVMFRAGCPPIDCTKPHP